MAGVNDKQLSRLGPWPLGVDNIPAETDLSTTEKGAIIALRGAVNVDIPESGKPRRRAGYVKRVAGASMHSSWRDGMFPFALFVDSGTLYGWMTGGEPWAIQTGLAPRDVSYALVNDRVYWGNGVQCGVVTQEGEALPLGVRGPHGQPILSASTAGGLLPGRYQVAVTFRDSRGEESGSPRAELIDLPQGGGITLSSVPQPSATNVIAVRVYLTPANGDVLYFARDLPVGMTSVTLLDPARGRPLDTLLLEAMPAPEVVRLLNSRLFCVVDTNAMVWSESLRYGLCELSKSRMRIGKRITLLEPVADGTDAAGLYVADEKKTYWLGGSDPARFTRTIAYPFGAIAGTGVKVPASVFGLESAVPVVYWLASNGVACIGLPGGQVVPLRESKVAAPSSAKGASLFRMIEDLPQVVTSLQSASDRRIGVGDRAVARVYRNGVEV